MRSLFILFMICFPLCSLSLRIAVITDTHIGENCTELTFDLCKPMRNLRDAVNHLNKLNGEVLIDGVFISGDLTSSALQDQMEMVRTLLDPLEMPWFPLLGNHDSWPYIIQSNGSFTQHDSPDGDQLFAQIFGDILKPSQLNSNSNSKQGYQISGFANQTCQNGDYPNIMTYHTNFKIQFNSLPSLSFLCLDWVARGSAYPYAGVGPEAELHDYPCGTTDWLRNQLHQSNNRNNNVNNKNKNSKNNKDNNNNNSNNKDTNNNDYYFLVQHHPFHNREIFGPFGQNKIKNFTFDAYQDSVIQGILSDYNHTPSNYLGVIAGHMHRWKRNMSAFTPFTAPSSSSSSASFASSFNDKEDDDDKDDRSQWQQLREYETSASKGWDLDEKYTSAITLLEFNGNTTTLNEDNEDDGIEIPILTNAFGYWLTPDSEWTNPPCYANDSVSIET